MYFTAILLGFISVSVALPDEDYQEPEVHNVITVPPNCPPGQEWVNGQCRDIWSWRNNPNAADLGVIDPALTFSSRNVITVPTNCPPGQQLINGACRDVWRFFAPTTPVPKQPPYFRRNVATVPTNCPAGQELINGSCRDVWRFFAPTTPVPKQPPYLNLEERDRRETDTEVKVVNMLEVPDVINRNIISIPNQCPAGYKPDALGYCRRIFD